MQITKSLFDKACEEISQGLLSINDPTKKDVRREIRKVCEKYSLERMPKKSEILNKIHGNDFKKLQNVLLKKPVKTSSCPV